MKKLTSETLRKLYLKFFEDKGHTIIPSASLIPENDPTVLFTTAGMHPLVPYLLGEKHPAGKRLTDVQKCVRTGDIDEVGDSSHCTFFEMMGNWSLGDYFKEEMIPWSFEFLRTALRTGKAQSCGKSAAFFRKIFTFCRRAATGGGLPAPRDLADPIPRCTLSAITRKRTS